MPADFTHWDWKNNYGRTVAHYAAINGHLPSGFTGWDWVDNKGQTVRQVYDDYLARQAK